VQQPTISIVTPSFNQAPFLEETIRSIVDQDYPGLEYVVIDGGSTDSSAEIIERYSPKLKYWVSETDRGHGHALNKGFAQTTGEIMAWLNSDDKYLPWTLEVVAEIFTVFPDVNWIVGTHAWWDAKGRLTHARPVYRNIYDYLMGNFRWIQQESVFWRRNLWERAGATINEDYTFMVDGELWCRFFQHDRLVALETVLGGYRQHKTNRAAQNMERCVGEMERAIDCMRHQCAPEVIDTLNHLREFIALKQTDKSSRSSVKPDTLAKYTAACEAAAYDRIHYAIDHWKMSSVRFHACD
jgi:glycosyltransferase involved in cell wall biosynthesis